MPRKDRYRPLATSTRGASYQTRYVVSRESAKVYVRKSRKDVRG